MKELNIEIITSIKCHELRMYNFFDDNIAIFIVGKFFERELIYNSFEYLSIE